MISHVMMIYWIRVKFVIIAMNLVFDEEYYAKSQPSILGAWQFQFQTKLCVWQYKVVSASYTWRYHKGHHWSWWQFHCRLSLLSQLQWQASNMSQFWGNVNVLIIVRVNLNIFFGTGIFTVYTYIWKYWSRGPSNKTLTADIQIAFNKVLWPSGKLL